MKRFIFLDRILKEKQMSTKHRKKLLKLVGTELNNIKENNESIIKDTIDKDATIAFNNLVNRFKIEKAMLKAKEENEAKEKEEKAKQNRKLQHKPKETYELLSSFSSQDGGIKNLTHAFNGAFIEYKQFIEQCRQEFDAGRQKYPNVPVSLLRRIEEFAFKEEPNWFIKNGNKKFEKKLGWSEPKFVEWYEQNKTHPALDAKYNKEMIQPFKESIQIRPDLGNLSQMIRDLYKLVFENNSAMNITINHNVDTANFYTNVDKLGEAIYQIFVSIKSAYESNFCDEMEIDYQINGEYKEIRIVHIGSESNKSVDDKDFLGGDLNSVKNHLWGLCNYEIVAVFSSGAYRKIILTDKTDEINKNFELENDVEGFTHILKFY